MTTTVPIYSEQPLTADAEKIINEVLSEFPKGALEFRDVSAIMQGKPPYTFPGAVWTGSTRRVLVFGSTAKFGVQFSYPWELVHTYSMAQIVTKANAVSVLRAALNQFYLPQKRHPTKVVTGPFSRLDVTKPIAVDIETSGDLGVSTPEQVGIISMSFYQSGKWSVWYGAPHVHDSAPLELGGCEPKCKRQTEDMVFSDADKANLASIEQAIWHNGKFDRRVIQARTGIRMSSYFDTMLAHHVLNQAAGDHKLKHLCRQYLGAPEWEGNLKQWTLGGAFYENIPTSKLCEYNAFDVYWTWELWKYLEALLFSDEQAFKAYLLETAAAEMLMEVEQYGFAIDEQYAVNLGYQMDVDIAAKLAQLQLMTAQLGISFKTGKPFNPISWQQVQQVISAIAGASYTGTTDEKALRKLISGVPAHYTIVQFIELLLKYRGLTKGLSTFVKGPLDRSVNGRVHTTFLVHGTSTGRLSSSGPNLQNIPRDKKYRGLYIG